jgi:hypothetical protein
MICRVPREPSLEALFSVKEKVGVFSLKISDLRFSIETASQLLFSIFNLQSSMIQRSCLRRVSMRAFDLIRAKLVETFPKDPAVFDIRLRVL